MEKQSSEYRGYKDLRVYQLSYTLAMEIFAEKYDEVNRMLYSMINQPEKFVARS